MRPIWQVPKADRLPDRDGVLEGNACCAVEQFLCQSDEDCVCLHIHTHAECQPATQTASPSLPSVTATATLSPLHLRHFLSFPFPCLSRRPLPFSFTRVLPLPPRPSLLFLPCSICVFSIRVIQALCAAAPLITVTATTAWQEKTNSTARAGY